MLWIADVAQIRFWSHVNTGGNCWPWTAGRFPDGYGVFNIDGRTSVAHHLAFEFTNGPIHPASTSCTPAENRACVRPEHLYLGDAASSVAALSSTMPSLRC
jgi:hypothetical protein